MYREEKEYQKYERDVIDVDEVAGTDIKINPDYYIHTALLKAQAALTKDNLQEGILQFVMIIEHIEVLCYSAGMLPDNYEQSIKDYKETEEYKKVQDKDMIAQAKVSHKKLRLMMSEVFKTKTISTSLKA